MSYQSGLSHSEEASLLRSDDSDLLPQVENDEAERRAAVDQYLRETATEPRQEGAAPEMSKKAISIGYMAAMGVCGIVLVALGSTLDDLAGKIGVSATSLGTVFIARGIGAILGAIASAKLYLWYPGNNVIAVSLCCIFVLLCILPTNTYVYGIHFLFFLLGLNTAITDTGCQIMTRKLHGKTAGPWLGANTVAFGISGALVPLIELLTDSLIIQYTAMALIVLAVAGWVGLGPNPETQGRLKGPPARDRPKIIHYHCEIVIGLMVFCFIGGKVTATAYFDTYVDQTSVIPKRSESALILVLWIGITVGRLAGVQDQRFLTNKTLPTHLTFLCIGGILSMLMILWFPKNGDCLWIGVAFYGLFNGPCVGYCYDWNNRITFPTEKSMSIVMFGLNFGASLVPFITTLIWDHGGGPETLVVVIFLSMLIPLPLLHITKYLSYDPAINPWVKQMYSSLPDEDNTLGSRQGLEKA